MQEHEEANAMTVIPAQEVPLKIERSGDAKLFNPKG